MNRIQNIWKNIPILVLAFILALTVWISAVTATDPNEENQYPKPIPLEIIGLDPSLVITNDIPKQVTIKLSAPRSIWNSLIVNVENVRALVDLSGLEGGAHDLTVQIQVKIRPVEVISFEPQTLHVELESLSRKTLPINLIVQGTPALGFQAEKPILDESQVIVSGPQTQVVKVKGVRTTLEIYQAKEGVSRSLPLEAYDVNDQVVKSVSLKPERITVDQPISQRGGYRNTVVKVVVNGTIASGYRLTSISASPPAVTLFSGNPENVNNLPGYIETTPVDIHGAKSNIEVPLDLILPSGVIVVGEANVNVKVGIEPIESSLTLSDMRVEILGAPSGLETRISPETVDVILSGPLPILEKLRPKDIQVMIELNNEAPGTYQRTPKVVLVIPELRVESIIPGTIEVAITSKSSGVPKTTATPVAATIVSPTP